jgi:biopolymer transport protein ExbD
MPQTQNAKREGVAPEIWVVGLIAVIIILLVLFGVAL